MDEYARDNAFQFTVTSQPMFNFLSSVADASAQMVILQRADIADSVACEALRILKPGGLLLCFTTTPLIAESANVLTSAGLRIRDTLAWIRPNAQSTSFGLGHVIRKNAKYGPDRDNILRQLNQKRTLRLRSCFTPIILAQKPYVGALLDNQLVNNTGLMNATRTASSNLSSNVIVTDFSPNDPSYDRAFLVLRPPHTDPADEYTRLYYHLLSTFTHDDSTIVDPSFTHCGSLKAALILHRNYIGNEPNHDRFNKATSAGDTLARDMSHDEKKLPNRIFF